MLTSSNFRHIHEIEHILRKGADALRPRYNKERVDSHRVEIQQKLYALTAPSSPPDGNNVVESTIPMVPVHSSNTATTSLAENGMLSVPPIPIHHEPVVPQFIHSLLQHSRKPNLTHVDPKHTPLSN